jgi:hypothetical protein
MALVEFLLYYTIGLRKKDVEKMLLPFIDKEATTMFYGAVTGTSSRSCA